MKKIAVTIACLGLILGPISYAQAESLYGFLDGKLYGADGNLRYICFMNGECLDENNIATSRQALGLAPVEQPALTPQQPVITPTQNPAQNPTVQNPTPAPAVNNPAPAPAPTPAFTPFSGAPYISKALSVRSDGFFEVGIGIDMVRNENDLKVGKLNDNYRLWCSTPLSPQGYFIDHARRVNGYNKAVATVTNSIIGQDLGHYSCKFIFTVKEGSFESNTVEFDLTQPQ